MCLAQAQFFVHFQMQLDKKLAGLLHRGQIMNGEAQALRRGANRFKKMFSLWRSRLRVHITSEGTISPTRFFDGVAQGMHLLEACRSSPRSQLHPQSGDARAPNAHAIDIQHAIHARYGLGDFLLQPLRRRVQQGVQRASAKLRAHP